VNLSELALKLHTFPLTLNQPPAIAGKPASNATFSPWCIMQLDPRMLRNKIGTNMAAGGGNPPFSLVADDKRRVT